MTNPNLFVASFISVVFPFSLYAQGTLTPPTISGDSGPIPALNIAGVPQASMKTLHQVQPSTPVNAINTPGDANNVHIIDKAGAYHLTRNLFTLSQTAIKITAAGVTLDLGGFEISPISSGPAGIELAIAADRCTIRNGSIKNYAFGVKLLFSGADRAKAGSLHDLSVTGHSNIALFGGHGWTIDRCRVHGGGNTGISSGDGSVITNCSVRDMIATNGTSGISSGKGSVIKNCSVSNCKVINGFFVGESSLIESCSATENQGGAVAFSYGIRADSRCIIRSCVANENTHTGNANDAGAGIFATHSSSVINCHANKNNGAGIIANQANTIESCKSHFNGRGGTGGGIHLRDFSSGTAGWNRIIGNDLTFNKIGIDCDTTANFIVKNRCGGNDENFSIIASNRVGAIVVPTNIGAISGFGNTQATGVSTTDPWANSTY